MTPALAGVVCAAMALPHLLRLERSPPATAATVWLAALLLRAFTAVFASLYVVVALPATDLFTAVTHWCWHTILPVAATHLGLDGHSFGDLARILPGLLLGASLLSVSFGLWRAARMVTRLIQRAAVGEGPRNSVILGDREVLVAAAGLRHPQVLISAGALTSFDDEELEASLEHERGHIARNHRYVLVVAELCRALGRFLPGTRAAARELGIHLERDADRFALARRHSPTALASAICKAAQLPSAAPMTALAGGGVSRRIRELLDADRDPVRARGLPVRVLATTMTVLVFALATVLPSIALAAVDGAGSTAGVWHCDG